MEGSDKKDKTEIFAKSVRAGKRTYFFDVKATKRDDYYITVTESKKRFNRDGTHFFEKHKLFLYKEDFEKFTDGLAEVVEYIKQHQPSRRIDQDYRHPDEDRVNDFTNFEFEDLEEDDV